MNKLYKLNSISDLHKILGVSPPSHPSISLIYHRQMRFPITEKYHHTLLGLYTISLKSSMGKIKYGRKYYDFEEGTLIFSAPNQVFFAGYSEEDLSESYGWTLFFHPDLLLGHQLAASIRKHHFFNYSVDEALHISAEERETIERCIQNILKEITHAIDHHSQNLIVSNLELLLNYCNRFYDRQFYTRSPHQKNIVDKVEKLLIEYFDSDRPLNNCLPSVKYFADLVNMSPNYLSDLLKKETGKTMKEHIDYYLLEKAKLLLTNTDLTISEIAYDLGFDYSKSLTKMFKRKTGITPTEFRRGMAI